MNGIADFRELFDYDFWANRAALASLVSVTPEKAERTLKLFGHIIGAERLWLARFDTPSPSVDPWPPLNHDDAAAAIEEIHVAWIALLEKIGAQGLERELAYRNTKGLEFKTPIRDVLMHLVMHSAYHRGQVAAAVREAGGKPAATDYVVWVRQHRKT
jgi:uncharacterized damage-inducible protein DinB